MAKPSPKFMKVWKTLNLYLCFINMGLALAILGPCILDLERVVNTDSQHIAFIYVARSIGYIAGSVLGGIILDSVKHKQAIMTVWNFFLAISIFAAPWSKNLSYLISYMVIQSFSVGVVDVGGSVLCLTLWGSESGPFFQALHFSYGVGGLIAPLIAAPFLKNSTNEFNATAGGSSAFTNFTSNFTNCTSDFTNCSSEVLFHNESFQVDGTPSIVYPFSIIGIFGLVVTVSLLVVCLMSPTEEKNSQHRHIRRSSSSYIFLLQLVVLNFLLIAVETGIEVGYAQMLTTFVVKGRLQLSTAMGSYMTSAFWGAFTISRLVSIFLAIKVTNFTLILCDLGVISIGSIVLLFLSSYEWAVWLASVLLGMGTSSFFPASMAWLNSYVKVTNKMAAVFSLGAACGGLVVPFTISYFIETFPDALIYTMPISTVITLLLVSVLYFILRKREKAKQEQEYSVVTMKG